ncbi:ESPR-type extended signal peptide-containing protein, partial [Bordetella tumbae]|uniref:ESPR-type extended signal peptide-containing protein n=1 Tax=Bordetella tumbae TaxID=1649139 RepID=UPI0039EEEF64
MNHLYRSIWNEESRTFVAVPETTKARGKRSSGARLLARGALAVAIAGAMGAAQATVTIDDSTAPSSWDGNEIVFSDGTGRIEFSGGGTVTGLTDASLNAGSSEAVSGRQLFQTNERVGAAETAITAAQGNITTLQSDVSTAQGNITTLQSDVSTAQGNITTLQSDVSSAEGNIATLQSQVGAIGTSITTASVTTDSLNVANGVIVADSNGVTIGTDVDMGGNKITNLADGTINATSTDAVTGKQIHNLFIEQGATGVRYFHANSAAPDSQAIGQESIAIGPSSEAREDNSFAAGVGAIADGESAIALGDGAQVSKPANNGDPTAAIAIGKDSDSSGVASTAIGLEATASGGNAVALGTGAAATGASGLALGTGAVADAENNISIGSGAGQGTGQHLPGDRSHNIAIGTASGQNVAGQFNVAMGEGVGNNVNGDDNVALGRNSGGLEGDSNVSIGLNANTGGTANRAVSIGEDTDAQTEGIAIGYAASAGNTGVAIGRQTSAVGTGTAIGPNAHADSGFVALGLNSNAVQSDVSGNSRFTNRAFSGSAVSVGSSEAGSEFTRRIVNVEDGANDTDAVNVRQLQQAVSGIDLSDIDFAGGVIANLQTQIDQNMMHYVSINDGGVDKGNKNNNGASATAIDSIAIGPDATTKNQDSIAIGHLAGAEGDSAVVLGHNIKGLGSNSTTIGNSQSEARDASGIAIGTNVVSRDENSIIIGRDSYSNRQANGPSVENSIVIGTESSSTAVEGIVVGKNSVVNAARGIAQGSGATATAENAMAFGTTASAAGSDSQASGTGANAFALNGIAFGTNARSGQANPDVELADSNHDSIAIGTSSIAERDSSIALGQEAQALGSRSTAIGYQAQVDPSVEASGVEGSDGLAIGSFAHSSGPKAGAIGPYANSSGNGSYAIGYMANATSDNGIALGVSSNSTGQNGIAIGMVSDASGGSSISIGTESEASGEFSMTVGGRATSSGDYSLAAGYGANALQRASLAMGFQSTANATNSSAIGRGASTAAGATDSIAMGTNAASSSANAVALGTGSAASGESALALGRGAAASNANAVALGSGAVTAAAVGTSNAVIDNVTYNYAGTNPLATVSVGSAGQERTLTNVAAGRISSTSTDAINGSQLYGTNVAVTAVGNDLDTAGQSVATVMGGNAAYDPVTHQVTTSNIGNTGEDTVHDAIGYAAQGWNVAANGEGTGANVAPGATVDFSNDDGNVVISRNGTDLAFNLANNIDLSAAGSVTTGKTLMNDDGLVVNDGGNSTVTSTAGTTVVNAVGEVTTVGAGSITVATPGGGQTTIGSNQINVGGSNPIAINGNTGTIGGLTNTTFDPDNFTSGQAATEDQLKLVSDVANAGWTATDAAGNSANIGPNGVVTFEGDDNLSVAQTGVDQNGVISVSLNQNIDLGNTGSVTTGNTVMNNDGLAVNDGAGNSTTTTVAGTTVTDAAGATTTVGAGTVSVVDAAGNSTAIGGNQISVGGSNPIVISGNTGTIGGLTNTTFDPSNYTSGQAATEDQLKQVNDVASAGWKATDAAGNSANIGPNGEVRFEGDSNISVAQTGVDQNGVVAVSLNENIDLGNTGSVTTGNTVMNNDGLAV